MWKTDLLPKDGMTFAIQRFYKLFWLITECSLSGVTNMKKRTMPRQTGHSDRLAVMFSLTVVCFLVQPANAKNKGFVTIATLGPSPISVDADADPQQVVNGVIAHWKHQFSRVLPDKPDLIVVPEACDRPRGISPDKLKDYYRIRKNQVRDYFAQVARDNNCYVVYSAKRAVADGTWRNSSVLIDRKGKVVGVYNKNHPTIGEIDGGIVAGRDAPVIECDFGRVAFAICFDLNIDEIRLKYVKAKPDLIVFSSMYHGGMMQAYWAYSCRSHFVGAIAGRATPSQILNPLGQVIACQKSRLPILAGLARC